MELIMWNYRGTSKKEPKGLDGWPGFFKNIRRLLRCLSSRARDGQLWHRNVPVILIYEWRDQVRPADFFISFLLLPIAEQCVWRMARASSGWPLASTLRGLSCARVSTSYSLLCIVLIRSSGVLHISWVYVGVPFLLTRSYIIPVFFFTNQHVHMCVCLFYWHEAILHICPFFVQASMTVIRAFMLFVCLYVTPFMSVYSIVIGFYVAVCRLVLFSVYVMLWWVAICDAIDPRVWPHTSLPRAATAPDHFGFLSLVLFWNPLISLNADVAHCSHYSLPNRLKEVNKYTTSAAAYSSAISPNGSLLVWGGEDNYMHVCNAATGVETGKWLGPLLHFVHRPHCIQQLSIKWSALLEHLRSLACICLLMRQKRGWLCESQSN